MTTGNAINLTAAGLAAYDGAGVFSGRTLTAGNAGVVITNGNGTGGNPTISVAALGMPWTVVTGASQAMTSNNGYIANRAGTVAFTLPTTSAVGDVIIVFGMNTATGWSIAYTTNQQIFFGTSSTTITSGSLASVNIRDSVTMICTTANLTWTVISSVGNITVA